LFNTDSKSSCVFLNCRIKRAAKPNQFIVRTTIIFVIEFELQFAKKSLRILDMVRIIRTNQQM